MGRGGGCWMGGMAMGGDIVMPVVVVLGRGFTVTMK